MQIRRGKPPGSGRLARTGVELSREARVRLAWMDFYGRYCNVVHTCRHFGISRQTFYRWQRRYDPYDLTTLEERSHCPRQRRLPTCSFPLEEKVLRLRLQFPRWGKDKLAVLLRRQKLRVRTGLPTARPPSVRPPSTLSQTQRRGRTRQSHPHRGVLPGYGLLAGNEETQPRTPALGKNLQHRPPSSGPRLPHPAAVPATNLISTEGMKRVTYLLDEYKALTLWRIEIMLSRLAP